MRTIFINLAILFSSAALFGQYSVRGKVLDENGRPLVGSSVMLVEISQGKITQSDGTFVFENLQENSHTLYAHFLGYEPVRRQVRAGENIEIRLMRKAFGLDELIVTSHRAHERSAVAFTNVSAEEMSLRNLGQDLPFLLMLTPSFVATSDAGTGIGYTGFRIRGTDANRVNVTINGIPFNDAQSHGSFFVNIPDIASSLSSIQVQRGVGTSTNGVAAFGASINMQTNHPRQEPFAAFSTTYGSFNTTKYTAQFGTGILENRMAFEARISSINSDGYVDRAFSDLKSYFFSAGYFGTNTTLNFITFGGREQTYQAWNGVNLDMVRANPHLYNRRFNEIGMFFDDDGNRQFYDNQTDNYTQIHYQLHWTQRFTQNLHLNMALHYTRGIGYYEEYSAGARYDRHGLTPDTLANGNPRTRTDLIRQRWLDNHFFGTTFSLNYNTNRIQATLGGAANRYLGDHYGKILWVRHPNNFDPNRDWYRNNAVKDDVSIFGMVTTEVARNLFATADMQFRYIDYRMEGIADRLQDITQRHEFHFFNPKFGLTYEPARNQRIYASFGIANREPNRNNFTRAGENERPTSERLYNTEIGYQFLTQRFSAGANFYYMRYRDQLILTGKISEIGQPLTTNIPDSYRAGVELNAAWKLSDNFRWDGNMTLSRNRILNFVERDVNVYDENWDWIGTQDNYLGTTDIAYSPNVIANSIFTFNHRNFEAGIHSFYVGRQFFDNTSSMARSIDPYFVSNLNLRYTLPLKNHLQEVDFRLMINNIFNVDYSSNAYTWYSAYVGGVRHNESRFFVQAGTNFLASVTVRF